ncbi:MAG: transporter substrate-binding domain-containing protein [Pseudomonadales bacterium]
MTFSRRDFLKALIASAPMGLAPSAFATPSSSSTPSPWITRKGTIKIGLLWSLTGHLSVIEKASRDVGLFWIDEVNRAGGIAGYPVEPVIIDASSDMKTYRQGILDLIQRENVLAIFGGYTSASRRAVMPLATLHGGLFYYPTCYAGRECWQHIICTGPIANQHSFDLIPYMVENYGPRAYFVGSNYIWPKESNRNALRRLTDIEGELVGEAYVPLGQSYFKTIFNDIKQKNPDWIFSTVVGDSDLHFRKQYAEAGFSPDKLPTASLTTSEMEVKRMGAAYGEGHILSAPYFQSLNNPANRQFVNNFLGSEYGESGVTHFNMEETYLAFLYFKKAVERVLLEEGRGALTPSNVRRYSAGLKLSVDESPEGEVWIDPDNFNSWLTPKIGRFNSTGQIDVLLAQEKQTPPKPYLLYPSRGECKADGLHLPNGKVVKAAS